MLRGARAFFLLLALTALPGPLPGRERGLVFVSATSVSRHFGPYRDRLNDLHLGIGLEAFRLKGRWLLGGSGHYMFNDSKDRAAYWLGIAPGYFIGDREKLWGSLALIAGGLRKSEYRDGRFSFFAMPFLTVGCNRAALNIAFIPNIARVSHAVLLVQFKVLVYP
jgi:hypothetical protein